MQEGVSGVGLSIAWGLAVGGGYIPPERKSSEIPADNHEPEKKEES